MVKAGHPRFGWLRKQNLLPKDRNRNPDFTSSGELVAGVPAFCFRNPRSPTTQAKVKDTPNGEKKTTRGENKGYKPRATLLSTILWMDKVQFAPLGNHLKPLLIPSRDS